MGRIGLEDVLDDRGLHLAIDVDALHVLADDQQPVDLDRLRMAAFTRFVAHGDHRLAVGAEIGQRARLPHVGEPPADPVREHDRQGHQLGRLDARVAEHHSLVAGADEVERIVVRGILLHLVRAVDASGDVLRLLLDRGDDAARVGVEAELGARVADLADPVAREPRNVDVRLGRDLAGDDHEPCRDERLAGNAARRILGEHGVEHRVGDLVGDLVRVAFRDGLGREQERSC